MDSEVKRRIISTALQRVGFEELRRLQSLVYDMLKRRSSYPAYEQLTSILREPALGLPFKTVALVACGLSRAIVASDSPLGHLAPLKELIWLKEKINIQLLVSASSSDDAAMVLPSVELGTSGSYTLAQRSLRNAAQLLKYTSR